MVGVKPKARGSGSIPGTWWCSPARWRSHGRCGSSGPRRRGWCRSAVTKKKLVVAADADSLSGKSRKAAVYGIPIVTEDAFATMLQRAVMPVRDECRTNSSSAVVTRCG